MNKLIINIIALFLTTGIFTAQAKEKSHSLNNSQPKYSNSPIPNDPIKPYTSNPRYWQYKGEPVLLLGASNEDNIFQAKGMKRQLTKLKNNGGNYLRNTMSWRDKSNLWPFKKHFLGKYDLNQWNERCWKRFEKFLKLADEKDIIVQIEIWDKFDYSRGPWEKNPFNPKNNLNYSTTDECGLEEHYPEHAGADLQPFFHTIPGMKGYKQNLEIIRNYQEKIVDKILSYTFQYNNILYCMNNETNTDAPFGNFWIANIRRKAKERNKEIYLTDMYEEFHSPQSCKKCRFLIKDPRYYNFMDISQINNRVFNEDHWDTLQWIMAEKEKYDPRPVNCTKVYGGGNSSWGSGSNQDGIERFCRDIIGGCAAVRHHRPPSGNGLNKKAINSIKAIRMVESFVPLWKLSTRMDLLSNRLEDQAYLAANEGESYLLYFTEGGTITLDLSACENKKLYLQWIDIENGEWGEDQMIQAGKQVSIKAPSNTGWFAVINNIE